MATAGARLPTAQLLGLIPSKQKLGLMVALAAITALVVAGWLWGQSPDYRVLYANLSDRDGGAVIASLQQMNVPFKFTEGGGALLCRRIRCTRCACAWLARVCPRVDWLVLS